MDDLQILAPEEGKVNFDVYGKSADTGLMLLQRIYVLLLASNDGTYRDSSSYTLLQFLEGGNVPSDGVFNSVLAICCSEVLDMLDSEDRDNIQELSAVSNNGEITCTLVLADGTTVKGLLNG